MAESVSFMAVVTVFIAVGTAGGILWKPLKAMNDLVNQVNILKAQIEKLVLERKELEERVRKLEMTAKKIDTLENLIVEVAELQRLTVRGLLVSLSKADATPEEKKVASEISTHLINK